MKKTKVGHFELGQKKMSEIRAASLNVARNRQKQRQNKDNDSVTLLANPKIGVGHTKTDKEKI